MFQHPEQDTDPQLCSCPATLGLDACPTQRGCWPPALLPWLYSYVIYLLYLLYFIDRSTAQCANSWETGQAVLVRGRCCSNYANAQARPIWPRCLWKLFWKTRHDRMDFNLVTNKKNPLSTAVHPPVWKQSSTCRLHSRAQFVWLEARLAPSGIYCGSERATGTKLTGSRAVTEETVKRDFLHNQQMAKNVTWWQIT